MFVNTSGAIGAGAMRQSTISRNERPGYKSGFNVQHKNADAKNIDTFIIPPEINENNSEAAQLFSGGTRILADAGSSVSASSYNEEVEKAKTDSQTMDVFTKCMKIAMHIIKGDNVPKKDDDFLFDNYPSMHLQAWSLRMEKANPEDVKSELDDEENSSDAIVTDIAAGLSDISVEMSVEALDVLA